MAYVVVSLAGLPLKLTKSWIATNETVDDTVLLLSSIWAAEETTVLCSNAVYAFGEGNEQEAYLRYKHLSKR